MVWTVLCCVILELYTLDCVKTYTFTVDYPPTFTHTATVLKIPENTGCLIYRKPKSTISSIFFMYENNFL